MKAHKLTLRKDHAKPAEISHPSYCSGAIWSQMVRCAFCGLILKIIEPI